MVGGEFDDDNIIDMIEQTKNAVIESDEFKDKNKDISKINADIEQIRIGVATNTTDITSLKSDKADKAQISDLQGQINKKADKTEIADLQGKLDKKVDKTTKIAGKALTGNITLTADDISNAASANKSTVKATPTFNTIDVRVSRVGDIVSVTSPTIGSYTTPGGYPAFVTLPAWTIPSTDVDILIAVNPTQFANILITTTGVVSVGMLGASGADAIRLNFSFVI